MKNRDMEKYRAWKRANYLKNREKELARKKIYHATEEGKKAQRKSLQNALVTSGHKISARVQLNKEVRAKRILRESCSICGDAKTDAHHPDYSQPLSVIWLCETHHYELHRKPRTSREGVYQW